MGGAAAAMDGKAAQHQHHHSHDNARLLKAISRTVEPRNFGIGLVAGFLLVTCAYFSTAKFDAIQIAPSLVGPSEPGIGSPVTAAAGSSKTQLDLGVPEQDAALSTPAQDLVHDASLVDTKKDDTFARGGDAAAVEAAKGEVFVKDDDDAGSGGALLPPLSSSQEPANGTQGVLDQEELNNPPNKISSSSNGSSQSFVPSDPATLPAPVQQTPPEVKLEEAKAPPVQQIPLIPEAVKQPGPEVPTAARREWKPLCDLTSNRRIDWCELDGDVRVHGANGTVTLFGAAAAEEWRVKPYPRKVDTNAMRFVREITVRSTTTTVTPTPTTLPGECEVRHDVPALLFSDRGYTGNYFHAYTDVILPLFLTAKRYAGEVQFLVSDMQMWWIGKFLPVFASLSNYPLVDVAADNRTRCFRHVQVGLTCHADFSIDPLRAPNGYSMVDFTKHMRGTYNLTRDLAVPAVNARPRLLLIARASTRRFVNADEIVRAAEKVGFEVVVSEGTHEVAPFAELANTCDAMLGVHGAGLTNMVFLLTGGVVIQVVPLGGLEFVAGYFRTPSRDMGLKYLEYRIAPAESTDLRPSCVLGRPGGSGPGVPSSCAPSGSSGSPHPQPAGTLGGCSSRCAFDSDVLWELRPFSSSLGSSASLLLRSR